MTEPLRSNVNPPTLHRPGVGVEGLKIHGVAIVTGVPAAMAPKSPELCRTNETFQRLTLVAVAREVVSKVATPPKSMLPVIRAASARCGKSPHPRTAATKIARRVLE